jgi:hypothetical protein
VAAGLVYHSDDFVAFELLRKLIECLPLKDLYQPMYVKIIVGLLDCLNIYN